MKKKKTTLPKCPRCDGQFFDISPCHLKCFRCGNELTCADKGNFW